LDSQLKSGNVAEMCNGGADGLQRDALKSGNVAEMCNGGADGLRQEDFDRFTNAWSN
jgi:hypothetical protein